MLAAMSSDSNRGLASADQETRERVARKGGEASHSGFANMPEDKQREIARKGGEASRSGGRND